MVADARQKLGVAAFVKTPGLSPIKTRLAAGIGAERAAQFYDLAVAAVRSVVTTARVTPFWAVAEGGVEAERHWRELPVISQGSGGLGSRIATVYDAVLARGLNPVLIGADAPQVSADTFGLVADGLLDHDFVMGPARDGGFYLLAGRISIPAAVFEGVTYSAATTATALATALVPLGTLKLLPALVDVDHAEDLPLLAGELGRLAEPTAAQLKLSTWIESHPSR